MGYQTRTPAASSRTRLREAGKLLFSEKGYDSTSLSEIARRAGTSQSQLINHFANKEGLLQAILDAAWEDINRAIRLAISKSPSLVDKLGMCFNIVLTCLENDPNLTNLLLLEGRRLRGSQHMIKLAEGYREFIETVDGIVREMADRNRLMQQITPEALRSALIGLVEGMLRDQLLARTSGFPAPYSEAEIRTLFSTLLSACLRDESHEREPRGAY
jgi:AcrR family transcriptional regulator